MNVRPGRSGCTPFGAQASRAPHGVEAGSSAYLRGAGWRSSAPDGPQPDAQVILKALLRDRRHDHALEVGVVIVR